MKRTLVPLLLLAAVCGLAADFKAGLDAYNRGDFGTALQEWQPLAERGDANAQYNLGLLYARGQGVPRDYAKAADWYRKAGDQGVAAAQYNLGVMYANGQGVPANAQEASKWFLKAAEQNVPMAETGLARVYYEGEGAFRNYSEAEKWYRKAAEQGVASAAFDLGVMYDIGQGVQQNYAEALKWYQKAADAGYAPAMANIGILYYNAQGVKRDLTQAYTWFSKAQKLGDPRGNALVEAARNKMKPGDIRKADAVLAQWQPPAKPNAPVQTAGLFKAPPATTGTATTVSAATQPATSAAATPPATVGAANPPATFPNNPTPPVNPPTSATTHPAAAASAATHPATVGPANPPATFPNNPTPPANSSNTTERAAMTGATTTAAANQPVALPNSEVSSPVPPRSGEAERTAPTAAAVIPSGAPHVQNVWTGVERVIAVGDVHGDYEQFVAVLKSAGLIDDRGDWIGGKAHLVQTGDVVDRGPDSRAVMDLLMKLENQAAAAGGGVHCLIGNHEAMDVYGDLRYVSPGEFASYAPAAAALTATAFPDGDGHRDVTAPATPAPGAVAVVPEQLPGFAQHRAAFGPEGKYGRWIRSHNAAIKIDRTLFVHAGLGPKYSDWSLDQIDDTVRAELNDFTRLHGGLVTDEQGPLWYRGLAKGDETQLEPLVDELLRHFDVDRIVVGHTYAQAAITPRFHGKVVLIDIGLSRVYDNVGKVGCLEIDRGHAYALHRGQGIELPKDETGPDMLRYLRQAAALDPKPSPLLPRIQAAGGNGQQQQ